MLRLLRQIHLLCGFALLVFVLLYALSGLAIQRGWPPRSPAHVTTHTERLDQPEDAKDADIDAFAQRLQDRFGMRGQRIAAEPQDDGSWRFVFRHPGTEWKAVIPPRGRTIEITEKRVDAAGILAALHRLHGYEGGLLYVAWAFAFDLASVALIVFPLTGVALWHATTRRRLVGWVVLAAVSAFTVVVVCALAWSP